MLDKFKPDAEYSSVYSIDFEQLYKDGKRGLIFDIDNTLVSHDAPCTEESDELLLKLEKMGFKTFILSNNKKERVEIFIPNVKIDYIAKAEKPSLKNYEKSLQSMGITKEEAVAIGDQLLTDCLGAKRFGITFIKVGIISKKEPPHIKFKRLVEKVIVLFTKG